MDGCSGTMDFSVCSQRCDKMKIPACDADFS